MGILKSISSNCQSFLVNNANLIATTLSPAAAGLLAPEKVSVIGRLAVSTIGGLGALAQYISSRKELKFGPAQSAIKASLLSIPITAFMLSAWNSSPGGALLGGGLMFAFCQVVDANFLHYYSNTAN